MSVISSRFCCCVGLLLLFLAQHLQAHLCYDCSPMVFNHSLEIDEFPSPTQPACRVMGSETGCFARVLRADGNVTVVSYGANLGLAIDTVTTEIERRLIPALGSYQTTKYIVYTCDAPGATPCNTLEKLKESAMATTLPSEERIRAFDELIGPAPPFNSSSCYEYTNASDLCAKTDLLACESCTISVEYSPSVSVCAVCPSSEMAKSLLSYRNTFMLTNSTRSDSVLVRCQSGKQCNSMDTVERIRRELPVTFDFHRFVDSSTSINRVSLAMLLFLLSIVGRM